MIKRVIALDNSGFPRNQISALEKELGYEVCNSRELSHAREALESGEVSLAIINPYSDFGGLNESYVMFIKQDLKQRNIPVILFSRAGLLRINGYAKLKQDEDYKVYVKKPCDPEVLIEAVKGLVNGA